MTATLDAPKTVPHDLRKQYSAPHAYPGQVVEWYRSGDPSGEPHAAIVLRVVNGRQLVVHVPELHHVTQSTLHVDDPDMKHMLENASPDDIEFDGAWQHTEETNKAAAKIDELTADIATLQMENSTLKSDLKALSAEVKELKAKK